MSATTVIIIAVALLGFGAYLGFVAVVSVGIRHEESLFRERRRLAEEESIMLGRPVPYRGFMDTAPGLVSHGARALTGLRVRRDRNAGQRALTEDERRPS